MQDKQDVCTLFQVNPSVYSSLLTITFCGSVLFHAHCVKSFPKPGYIGGRRLELILVCTAVPMNSSSFPLTALIILFRICEVNLQMEIFLRSTLSSTEADAPTVFH